MGYKVLTICCLLVGSIYAIQDDTIELMRQAKLQWPMYKKEFNLTFEEDYEDERRFNIYANNHLLVERHNRLYKAGLETYEMELNQYSYMTIEEFTLMNGFPPEGITDTNENLYGQFDETDEEMDPTGEPFFTEHVNVTAPRNFDWRSRGKVTRVKQQGRCGSCWAFAAIAAIESQYAIHRRRLVDLSEQELVDCVPSRFYCRGCRGGNPYWAMRWARTRRAGIMSERSYPYRGRQSGCRYNRRGVVTSIRNLYQGRRASFNRLKNLCYQRGPIVIFVNVNRNFQHYKRGVFRGYCPNNRVNHLVAMTGWQGSAYVIKNSWGTRWGENGYIRMARGRCGVENHQWTVPQV